MPLAGDRGAATRAGSKPRCSTTVPPASSVGVMSIPAAWEIGAQAR